MGAVFIFLAKLRTFETEKLGSFFFVSSENFNNFASFILLNLAKISIEQK